VGFRAVQAFSWGACESARVVGPTQLPIADCCGQLEIGNIGNWKLEIGALRQAAARSRRLQAFGRDVQQPERRGFFLRHRGHGPVLSHFVSDRVGQGEARAQPIEGVALADLPIADRRSPIADCGQLEIGNRKLVPLSAHAAERQSVCTKA